MRSLRSRSPGSGRERTLLRLGLMLAALTATSVVFANPPKAAPSAAPPAAPASYSAEVLVLHATNGDKGIDPRIGEMPELKQPPFSSYKSYELLSKVKLPLKKDDPKTTELPNGRVLQTKLVDVLPDDAMKISASINQPGGKTFLPLLEVKAKVGQSFIVAGQSYKSGILVLVIRVTR
ncbi:MAG TPA: hypothetical protein VHE30_18420 [Polyangiaceae bacterium]|nr:hypothetical protein [Polyangiaceae bacterium]